MSEQFCTCEAADWGDCSCSLKDGTCLRVTGSGSDDNPFALEPVLDPDTDSILTCSEDGLLVKLPLVIRVPPAAQAYHGSNQSIPNDDGQVVSLNGTRYDNDSMHSTTTNNSRLTFNTEGVYIVTFNCSFAGNATGDREAWIRKNGKDFLGKSAKPAPNAASMEAGLSVTIQEFFEEDDYIESVVKQDSGGALNLLATRYSPVLSVRYRRGAP